MWVNFLMGDYIEVGKVTSTRGLRGEVNVQSWCNTPRDLCKFNELFLDSLGHKALTVEKCRASGGFSVILKLNNINNVEEAKNLINKVLYANKTKIELEEGEILIADLIGLKVVDYDNTERVYGEVVDVIKGGNKADLYEIMMSNGKKVLVPSVGEIIKSKDITRGVIKIKPIDGLLECAF